ncbi:MAG: SDR family oxidoreductase [Phycisphaeraceae bacterium]|nr:SDR family oxidoreductase [Phycisphaeraceae bacterium]
MKPLAGRIGIITGATAGIGRATARAFVESGARVVINGRRADVLKEVVAELGEERVGAVAGDCAAEGVIQAMFGLARSRFGGVADLVVVNAGRGLRGGLVDSDEAQWEEMIRTNLLGAARLMRFAANEMLADIGTGDWQTTPRDIVVLGSVVGRHVSPFSGTYGSTKFAVHALAEGLRRDVGPKGVRVTLVEPGFVISEFQGVAGYADDWFRSVVDRIGPVLEPGDVADAITFAVSRPARVHVGDIVVRPTRQDYP